MTTPTACVCPKCGEAENDSFPGKIVFLCMSALYATGTFVQSNHCRILELESENAQLRASIKSVEKELSDKADYYTRTAEVSESNADEAASEAMKVAVRIVRQLLKEPADGAQRM